MSSAPSSRKGTSRGGGRGRGGRGGGRGRSGRGRFNNKRSERGGGNTTNNNSNNGSSQSGNNQSHNLPSMSDEEILIAFMPFLKGDNQEAMVIHELYQSNNDQPAFLTSARDFLAREQQQSTSSHTKSSTNQPQGQRRTSRSPPPPTLAATDLPRGNSVANHNSATPHKIQSNISQIQQTTTANNTPAQSEEANAISPPIVQSFEDKVASLVLDDEDHDPAITMLQISQQQSAASTLGPGVGVPPGASLPPTMPTPISSQFPPNQTQQPPVGLPSQRHGDSIPLPITPPRNPVTGPSSSMQNYSASGSTSPFSTLFPSANKTNGSAPQSPMVFSAPPSQPYVTTLPPPVGGAVNWSAIPPPGMVTLPPPVNAAKPQPHPPQPVIPSESVMRSSSPAQSRILSILPASSNNNDKPNNAKSSNASVASVDTVGTAASDAASSKNNNKKSTTVAAKKEYQPKRLWTRLHEQPGKLNANNVAPSKGMVVDLRPRQELTAQWMLPLPYLREKAIAAGTSNEVGDPLRNVLKNLAVGLFRRGCTDNGAQASIVTKEIISPPGESRKDYPYKTVNNSVVGTVPFYSPRTPGHVVFRLYWQDEPTHTLATGPTLNVRIKEGDFESSIRFILSNFKARKVNPTSLSSLHSFALVLEQFQVAPNINQQTLQHQLDGAGRAVWGCICEARKIVDGCASEYVRTTEKLQALEESVEGLKAMVEGEEKEENGGGDDETGTKDSNNSEPKEESPLALELKEKRKSLMSGRASCERKWRDSQLAFASILKAIVTNPGMAMLLRRELVNKLRLEYELWCPLCEEFAIPSDNPNVKMWYEPLSNLPHTLTADHFRLCAGARTKMQLRILGFEPNTTPLEHILYPNRRNNRQMNPVAVNVFNQLSTAMGNLYQAVYATEDRIFHQREIIRSQTEKVVCMCDCFATGTKVAIFGSSANGFGSPKSDLDMCLHLPSSKFKSKDKDDPNGSSAMAELASMLEKYGMKDVDTSRLSARIPVIKFNFPKHGAASGEDDFLECDLSMHNPLAVLNTALLRTYADINPVARVLAGVVKRWAKARDINNPARHTLSSYGYILMLLHFLTFHQRSGNGLVIPLNGNADGKRNNAQNSQPAVPLLPNLQWMDRKWPELPPGTPYMEYADLPKSLMQHPLESKIAVNSYFCHPTTPGLRNNLQRLFPGQDLSLGILLASFFRYYAYEFDYKRHVVSLHATATHGPIEREVKAELDGWRNYSAALTIEDPFETFYDVAHVLRGGYYHRIRREFAVAYSKIADVAMGKTNSNWGDGVDLSKMDGKQLVDWVCEPIPNERDEQQLHA